MSEAWKDLLKFAVRFLNEAGIFSQRWVLGHTRYSDVVTPTWKPLNVDPHLPYRKGGMILRIFCLLIFIIQYSIVYCEEIDGKALLKKGKGELERWKYEDAIRSLSEAEKEFPLLGDYALLWLSEAYHETGNHAESLKTIRSLLKKYPDSPLIKKSRIKEIEEAEKVSEENLQQMFESFLKDYPNDNEIKYAFAKWLKKNDKLDAAKSIFKEIYISGNLFSGLAYNEISHYDVTVEDLIKRASNLMEFRDFRGAESALRSALEKDNGSLKKEILQSLGHCLFKQKRYHEAAKLFEKVDEKFWKCFSLYRLGDKEALLLALEDLKKTEDKRAGSILNAVASDKRRDGEIEDALKIYQEVMEKYPSAAEDARWGIGWTYYLSGYYEKAIDIFTKLYEDYGDNRYLYWNARSIENAGKDANDLYQKLKKIDKDFYSVLSLLKTERLTEQINIKAINMSSARFNFPFNMEGYKGGKKFDRVEVLFEIGLSKEALSELIYVSKTITSNEDIMYLCSKFQALGEYRYIANLSERIPYNNNLHHIFYPLAYWDFVESISQKYDIDPFLVISIIREESMFNPGAKSIAGALGLMQLIPQTAFWLEKNLRLGIENTSEICDIKNNISLGAYYLSILKKEFGDYAYVIAAYNAGEERVRKWYQKGNYKSIDEFIEDIPFRETRNYVKRVMTTMYFGYKKIFIKEDITKDLPQNI
ncbi:MAG: transglycosylase SLT domain-containing protein [Nitrospirae bacterium]|nr:transglycosylase SLT domain-containing protein [Nitrospirota bacterium]